MYVGHDNHEYEDAEMDNMRRDAREDNADIADILKRMDAIDREVRKTPLSEAGIQRILDLIERYRASQAALESARERQFLPTAQVIVAQMRDWCDDADRLAHFLHDLALYWVEETLAFVPLDTRAVDIVDKLSNIVEED